MPIYKDNAHNRRLKRVGMSWGKEAKKSSPPVPVKKASKKASKPDPPIDTFMDALSIMGTVAKSKDPLGFYEINTSHKDYIGSDKANYGDILEEPVWRGTFGEGGWYQAGAGGGAGLSAKMKLSTAKKIRSKYNLGKSMRKTTTDNPVAPYINYQSF